MNATATTAPPLVVIVGRPNVGKSTMFNRLVGQRKAITLDTPGITRDPITQEVEWYGRKLRLVDTGGLGGEADIALADAVHRHTLASVRGAQLAVVVFDARAGLSPLDRETIDILEDLRVPALYVANKADGPTQDQALVEFCRLGIDQPLALSAEHGLGLGELKRAVVELLPDSAEEPSASGDEACRVAVVGRPNVGKSSLLNQVAGEQLSLVDDAPGTTRDTVDLVVEQRGKRYLLVDTAGLRRPAKVDAGIEKISVGRSIEALRRCQVVVLLIEPLEGMTDQDARIAQLAISEGRALVIMVNKVDILPRGRSREWFREETYRRYPTLGIAELGFMSALKGQGIDECFAAIDRADAAHRLATPTSEVNRILALTAERREPPVISGGRLRLLYAAQTASRPPTFTVFVNREDVPHEYVKFLERNLRECLPLRGTPLRLRFRRRASHGQREPA